MDRLTITAIRAVCSQVSAIAHKVHGSFPLPLPCSLRNRLSLAALLILLPLSSTLLSAPNTRTLLVPVGVRAAPVHVAASCLELLNNGNLEASGGWTFGPTPAPAALVNAPVHSGAFALRLGIASGGNKVAYSTAYQSVTLPPDATTITLTYWERPGLSGDISDFREVLALRTNYTVLRIIERQNGAGNDQWTQRTFDLTDLRGQTIVLYFNVYNNGSGATLVNYLDDLSLQSCDNAATPTPTSAVTVTPTATITVTPPTTTPEVTVTPPVTSTPTATATPTGTPTATVTPPPSGIVVRAGSVTLSPGQTTIQVPLDLVGASDETPVGVLSVALHYDAALLEATACTVSDRVDLLLCNPSVPGVVRLAGVAANGIRGDLQVAGLDFALRQGEHLNTQLMVQVETVADLAGEPISASGQNGQILTPCAPASTDCPAASYFFYLPMVTGGSQ